MLCGDALLMAGGDVHADVLLSGVLNCLMAAFSVAGCFEHQSTRAFSMASFIILSA